MRPPIRTKSKAAILVFLVLSLAMLVYRFTWMYRGTKFSGRNASKVLTTPAPANANLAASGNYSIKEIVDGDTVVLSDGTVVRYTGVDTPEENQPFYEKATEANRALIGARQVEVRFCTNRQADKYNRRLGALFSDGVDVTRELLRDGMGRVFPDFACLKPSEVDKYWEVSLDALRRRVGIWADLPPAPIRADQASSYKEKSAVVCGKVDNIFRGPQAIHINFGSHANGDFSATVFLRDEKRFRNAGVVIDDALAGRNLTVFGHIVDNQGAPNMVISSPVQWKLSGDCSKPM